jgi:hypothetical protein
MHRSPGCILDVGGVPRPLYATRAHTALCIARPLGVRVGCWRAVFAIAGGAAPLVGVVPLESVHRIAFVGFLAPVVTFDCVKLSILR